VIYNLNHNSSVLNVLGRFRNSEKDTLKLELRADGVYNSCDLPQTTAANDALELIKRGDINGQSFAFEDDWEDTENGVSYERTNETIDGKEVWIRHVKKIIGLYDVSIVTHPAYEQTSVTTRENSEAIDKAIEEQLKRECGSKKKAEDGEETDEEKAKREQAEREANGGETNAEKEAREAQEREANGGETNAEKAAREERELEEQAERARQTRELHLRMQRMKLNRKF
jgi:HK97 family phage prohead protease